MSNNRKDFERPVTYTTVGYRIRYAEKHFVNIHGESTDSCSYAIATRSLALRALRQYIWDNHKNQGYTYDIADFYIESRGYYNDDRFY